MNNKFFIGDNVLIIKGEFSGYEGVIESMDGWDGDPVNGVSYEYLVRLKNTENLFPIVVHESNLSRVSISLKE